MEAPPARLQPRDGAGGHGQGDAHRRPEVGGQHRAAAERLYLYEVESK